LPPALSVGWLSGFWSIPVLGAFIPVHYVVGGGVATLGVRSVWRRFISPVWNSIALWGVVRRVRHYCRSISITPIEATLFITVMSVVYYCSLLGFRKLIKRKRAEETTNRGYVDVEELHLDSIANSYLNSCLSPRMESLTALLSGVLSCETSLDNDLVNSRPGHSGGDRGSHRGSLHPTAGGANVPPTPQNSHSKIDARAATAGGVFLVGTSSGHDETGGKDEREEPLSSHPVRFVREHVNERDNGTGLARGNAPADSGRRVAFTDAERRDSGGVNRNGLGYSSVLTGCDQHTCPPNCIDCITRRSHVCAVCASLRKRSNSLRGGLSEEDAVDVFSSAFSISSMLLSPSARKSLEALKSLGVFRTVLKALFRTATILLSTGIGSWVVSQIRAHATGVRRVFASFTDSVFPDDDDDVSTGLGPDLRDFADSLSAADPEFDRDRDRQFLRRTRETTKLIIAEDRDVTSVSSLFQEVVGHILNFALGDLVWWYGVGSILVSLWRHSPLRRWWSSLTSAQQRQTIVILAAGMIGFAGAAMYFKLFIRRPTRKEVENESPDWYALMRAKEREQEELERRQDEMEQRMDDYWSGEYDQPLGRRAKRAAKAGSALGEQLQQATDAWERDMRDPNFRVSQAAHLREDPIFTSASDSRLWKEFTDEELSEIVEGKRAALSGGGYKGRKIKGNYIGTAEDISDIDNILWERGLARQGKAHWADIVDETTSALEHEKLIDPMQGKLTVAFKREEPGKEPREVRRVMEFTSLRELVNHLRTVLKAHYVAILYADAVQESATGHLTYRGTEYLFASVEELTELLRQHCLSATKLPPKQVTPPVPTRHETFASDVVGAVPNWVSGLRTDLSSFVTDTVNGLRVEFEHLRTTHAAMMSDVSDRLHTIAAKATFENEKKFLERMAEMDRVMAAQNREVLERIQTMYETGSVSSRSSSTSSSESSVSGDQETVAPSLKPLEPTNKSRIKDLNERLIKMGCPKAWTTVKFAAGHKMTKEEKERAIIAQLTERLRAGEQASEKERMRAVLAVVEKWEKSQSPPLDKEDKKERKKEKTKAKKSKGRRETCAGGKISVIPKKGETMEAAMERIKDAHSKCDSKVPHVFEFGKINQTTTTSPASATSTPRHESLIEGRPPMLITKVWKHPGVLGPAGAWLKGCWKVGQYLTTCAHGNENVNVGDKILVALFEGEEKKTEAEAEVIYKEYNRTKNSDWLLLSVPTIFQGMASTKPEIPKSGQQVVVVGHRLRDGALVAGSGDVNLVTNTLAIHTGSTYQGCSGGPVLNPEINRHYGHHVMGGDNENYFVPWTDKMIALVGLAPGELKTLAAVRV